ncbi:hypothetical protein PSYMO_12992, partial [Pseudomonas amygdali pv. mori str. 301020]
MRRGVAIDANYIDSGLRQLIDSGCTHRTQTEHGHFTTLL